MYRTVGLTPAEIWEIAARHYERPPQLVAKARGMGPAKAILQVGLTIETDGFPHPRHANVIGWADDLAKKHVWKNQAQKIAAEFGFELRPVTPVMPS